MFQAVALPAAFPRSADLDLRVEFVPTGWALLTAAMAAAWAWWMTALARRLLGQAT
jgi:hypothetical protein